MANQQQPQIAKPQAALAPVETSATVNALVPTSIDGAMQLARWLSQSTLLPPAFKGREPDIFMIVMSGMELGLPPMAALRGIYVVNGRTALESKTKAAICLAKGAALYFKRIEHTPFATTWETLRAGQSEPVRARYTLEEAKAAGLTRKEGPWQSYPQRMISHRALGWLCDDVYSDVVMGVASAEDFDPTEFTFRPLGGDLSIAPAPEPKQPPPAKLGGPPADAKDANVKEEKKPPTIPEDEIVDLITKIGSFGTALELRAFAKREIAGRPMDEVSRARLAKAYEDHMDELDLVAQRERAEEEK